jgi:ribosomal protein S18 acetylase RimI-like enzyme
MPLVVRRVRVQDLPVLDSLESETAKRFPTRGHWMEAYRALLDKALEEEPEGLLVADYDGRPIGAVVTRQRGVHPFSGKKLGRVEALTVAPGWKGQGIAERLLKESEAYLKAQGCAVMSVSLPSDAGVDGDIYKQAGFKVAAWELERGLDGQG